MKGKVRPAASTSIRAGTEWTDLFSLAAELGSLTLGLACVRDLGYVGAACEIAALSLTIAVGKKLRHPKAATSGA